MPFKSAEGVWSWITSLIAANIASSLHRVLFRDTSIQHLLRRFSASTTEELVPSCEIHPMSCVVNGKRKGPWIFSVPSLHFVCMFVHVLFACPSHVHSTVIMSSIVRFLGWCKVLCTSFAFPFLMKSGCLMGVCVMVLVCATRSPQFYLLSERNVRCENQSVLFCIFTHEKKIIIVRWKKPDKRKQKRKKWILDRVVKIEQ